MTPTLADLEALARGAGEIVRAGYSPRPGYEQKFTVEYKGRIDLVTEFDKRSEAYLLKEIRSRFPSHRIETEETGLIHGDEGCVWYLDPIDGTTNYVHGLAHFAISIGYAEEGKSKLGVVYDPVQDECFSAERGKGAWLNGYPLRAANTSILERSLVSTAFAHDGPPYTEINLKLFNRFIYLTQNVMQIGSAAQNLCYVAAGRLDAYWEVRIQSWDIAAGALIASEAGAIVSKIDGDCEYLHPPYSILAAAPALHPQMLEVIHQVGQSAR